MNNENNSNIDVEPLDSKNGKATNKQNVLNPVVEMKKLTLGGKKVCIGLSIVSVIVIWVIMFTPLAVLGIRVVNSDLSNISTINNTIFNLLPPINISTNYSNFTIERVECVDDFVYVPGDEMCYPGCDWNPTGDDSVRVVRLILNIFSVFSILLCTATLLVWVVISCVDWKKFRFHYDFQLPRTSLFMVVLTSLILVVLYAAIDLTPREFFFCQSTVEGQSYFLAHMFYTVSNVPYLKLITNVLGALTHYIFLVTVSWIIFSLININVIVFFPQLMESFKRRLFIFLFQCLFCFGFNLVPVALTIAIDPDSPYVVSYLLNNIGLLNIYSFLLLFDVPYFLTPGVVILLTVMIVTKLRIISLRSERITGRTIKLTDLEKRLLIYGIILVVLMLLQGINFFILTLVSFEYFEFVTEFVLCMTVNSPILTLPSNLTGSNATLNATVSVYRENPYGDVDACRLLESEAGRLYPQTSLIFVNILFRLIWLPIFFVLIPNIIPRILKRWYKGLKDKYTTVATAIR